MADWKIGGQCAIAAPAAGRFDVDSGEQLPWSQAHMAQSGVQTCMGPEGLVAGMSRNGSASKRPMDTLSF